MNSIAQTLTQPMIYSQALSEEAEKDASSEEQVSEITSLAPFVGTFLAHNTTQSLLLGRTVTYFSSPLSNYFLNVPIAALGGVIAHTIEKMGFSGVQRESASTDAYLEAATKSLSWSSVFSAAGAIGLHKLILESPGASPFSKALMIGAGNVVGPATVEVIFAIASTCLSMALMDLFNEEPKQASSQK